MDLDTGVERTPLVIRSAQDAIAAVPYMLGYHPGRSLVVIGYDGPHTTCAVRLDLPPPDEARAAAERVAAVLAGNRFRQALVLGYGDADDVAPAVAPMCAALDASGLDVTDAIRVADGRWWSLTSPGRCPPEGHAYDAGTSVVPAQATLAGHVVLADRAELARSVEPVGGDARAAMRAATDRAERRYFGWFREGLSPARIDTRLAGEGLSLLPGLLSDFRAGRRPTDDEVAWLGVLLTSTRVRDEAWVRIDEDAPAADIEFWSDVVRRVEDRYSEAPACLLAFAAYVSGDGGLANIALDRAGPDYSMGVLLREMIAVGIPPSKVRLRMTPEQLALAYTDREEPPDPTDHPFRTDRPPQRHGNHTPGEEDRKAS